MVDFLQDDMDFSAYMQETEVKATVLPASSWRQGLKDSVRLKNRENLVFLPWAKVNPFFDFRGGEVTIWAGQNGHGKSQVTDMVKLSLMGQGQKVGNASFEMMPLTHSIRAIKTRKGFKSWIPCLTTSVIGLMGGYGSTTRLERLSGLR